MCFDGNEEYFTLTYFFNGGLLSLYELEPRLHRLAVSSGSSNCIALHQDMDVTECVSL